MSLWGAISTQAPKLALYAALTQRRFGGDSIVLSSFLGGTLTHSASGLGWELPEISIDTLLAPEFVERLGAEFVPDPTLAEQLVRITGSESAEQTLRVAQVGELGAHVEDDQVARRARVEAQLETDDLNRDVGAVRSRAKVLQLASTNRHVPGAPSQRRFVDHDVQPRRVVPLEDLLPAHADVHSALDSLGVELRIGIRFANR